MHHSTSTMHASDWLEFQREASQLHLTWILFYLASLISLNTLPYPRLNQGSKAFSFTQDLTNCFLLTTFSLLQSLLQKAGLFLKLIPQQSSINPWQKTLFKCKRLVTGRVLVITDKRWFVGIWSNFFAPHTTGFLMQKGTSQGDPMAADVVPSPLPLHLNNCLTTVFHRINQADTALLSSNGVHLWSTSIFFLLFRRCRWSLTL